MLFNIVIQDKIKYSPIRQIGKIIVKSYDHILSQIL